MKSKGNAIGGIAWFLGLDLGLSLSRVSIYGGTLVFFCRLVWLLVLGGCLANSGSGPLAI